jgi:hypothetical protein
MEGEAFEKCALLAIWRDGERLLESEESAYSAFSCQHPFLASTCS